MKFLLEAGGGLLHQLIGLPHPHKVLGSAEGVDRAKVLADADQ